jgi:hypothetical protein
VLLLGLEILVAADLITTVASGVTAGKRIVNASRPLAGNREERDTGK